MEDIDIIKLYFERSEKAIEETTKKYYNLCMRISKNILQSREDSEECINDTLMCLWNTIPPRQPNNLSAYICKIARNHSLKKLEYNTAVKRNINVIVSFEELEHVLPSKDATSNINYVELGELLTKFLKGLKKEQRVVFVRRYYFFDSIVDISKSLSFSESKVKSMLFHTRNKLEKYLREEGYEI